MSKYNPLRNYLSCCHESERTHTLRFDEVEGILGDSLPRTARVDRPWWVNTRSSTHAVSWLDAGWKMDKVDLSGGRVTFVRTDGDAGPSKIARNRYENLGCFFKSVPSQQEQIALTFKELGAVMGGRLPDTAFHDRPWWANTKSSPQGSSWMTTGLMVEIGFSQGPGRDVQTEG